MKTEQLVKYAQTKHVNEFNWKWTLLTLNAVLHVTEQGGVHISNRIEKFCFG